jgi:competence ComEA-like helix-hairpin-helix protein
MVWLTARERLALAAIGAAALLGRGALLWQRQSLDFPRDAVPSAVEGRRRPPLAVIGSPAPAEAVRWEAALDEAKRVDVNAAGVAALERLPGVGPALAQRIVDHRRVHGRFRTADKLQDVRGIGPGLYDSLRDYVAAE